MFNKFKRLVVITILCVFSLLSAIPSLANETRIEIPSIGVNSAIVNAALSSELGTWDVSHLYHTVGHMEYTPWFGSAGNSLLGGHSVASNGSPDVFYDLDKVAVGDEITIHDSGSTFRYQVTDTRVVEFTDVSIIYDRGGETLTIFTCQVQSHDGNGFYSRRHVIFANRIG